MNRETLEKLKIKHDELEKFAALSQRRYPEESRDRIDGSFQRDYTRIMYASSFRRLQGKMQLLGIQSGQFFRNRLTHSLEVAQIARSIAAKIGYSALDIYVVEAGALAHDLGNPPFGHYGERVLNRLCHDIGGFEGNAQTLRVLTDIEKKRPEFRGLNLTYRTLFSVVKYLNRFDSSLEVGSREYNAQKFIYDEDFQLLTAFIQENNVETRTLDVQIVDIADEIAYAAHDLEDCLRQKLFTIDEILHDYKARYGDSSSYRKLYELVEECRGKVSFGSNRLDSTEYSKLLRKELASSIIYTLIQDLDLVEVSEKKRKKTNTTAITELGFSMHEELAAGLKAIVFKGINHNDEVYHYEQKGGYVMEQLFDLFCTHPMYLPPEYRAWELMERAEFPGTQAQLQHRLVSDYIAGMMDSYALSVFTKHFGENALLKSYVRGE